MVSLAAGGACCCTLLGVVILLGIFSFSTLHATEWGLDYNGITMSVAPEPLDAGLHFIGPGHHFIRFPNTYQNMQFSTGDQDLLHTRTSDGLPLTLGISFQYTLLREQLYALYMQFTDTYTSVLFNVATNIIANTACNYTAYNFFNDKQAIAMTMQQNLADYARAHLHLHIESLQITLVELSKAFEDAILESISVKQEITRTEKQKQTKQVYFETQIMAAHQSANQTVTAALGLAAGTRAERTAAAQVVRTNVRADSDSYKRIKSELNLDDNALMEYIWWDTLAGQSSEMVVGVNGPNVFNLRPGDLGQETREFSAALLEAHRQTQRAQQDGGGR